MFVRLPVANPDFILRWVTEKFSCPSGFKLRWGLKNFLAFRALKFSLIRGEGGPGPPGPFPLDPPLTLIEAKHFYQVFSPKDDSHGMFGGDARKSGKRPFVPRLPIQVSVYCDTRDVIYWLAFLFFWALSLCFELCVRIYVLRLRVAFCDSVLGLRFMFQVLW